MTEGEIIYYKTLFDESKDILKNLLLKYNIKLFIYSKVEKEKNFKPYVLNKDYIEFGEEFDRRDSIWSIECNSSESFIRIINAKYSPRNSEVFSFNILKQHSTIEKYLEPYNLFCSFLIDLCKELHIHVIY